MPRGSHCVHHQPGIQSPPWRGTSTCTVDPQPRAISQAVQIIRDGELVAYPTDSCFALGCALGNQEGKDRILRIRHLDDRHHFTLVCKDFAQLGTSCTSTTRSSGP